MSIYFTKKHLNEDISGHYYYEEFGDGFRVVTKYGAKYAFSSISKKQFERYYRKYWNCIIVDLKRESFRNKEIIFTDDELMSLKQQIILNGIYFYAINNMKIELRQLDLDGVRAWNEIRWLSQEKYGIGTDEADIVAANTIGIHLEKYIEWRRCREFFESQW